MSHPAVLPRRIRASSPATAPQYPRRGRAVPEETGHDRPHLARPARSLLFRAVSWYSNRAYGKVVDPLRAGAHHTGVLWALPRPALSVSRWKKLDPQLKAPAVMASAATVGCS